MKVIEEYTYITRKKEILDGEPIIEGTRTSARAIVELWRAGIDPEEIVCKLPHLTLAQVFGALSFYSDHKEEINEYIRENTIPENSIDPIVKDLK